MKKTIILAAIALLSLAASAAASATPAGLPGGYWTTPQVKPAYIVYTGDGSGEIKGYGSSVNHAGRIRWTAWSATNAYGNGMDWIRTSWTGNTPRFTGYRVSLHGYRPVWMQGKRVFSRLLVSYTHGRPPRFSHSHTMTVATNTATGTVLWQYWNFY